MWNHLVSRYGKEQVASGSSTPLLTLNLSFEVKYQGRKGVKSLTTLPSVMITFHPMRVLLIYSPSLFRADWSKILPFLQPNYPLPSWWMNWAKKHQFSVKRCRNITWQNNFRRLMQKDTYSTESLCLVIELELHCTQRTSSVSRFLPYLFFYSSKLLLLRSGPDELSWALC